MHRPNSRERKPFMHNYYHSGYVSLNHGVGLRWTPRRLFYFVLGLVLTGASLWLLFAEKRTNSQHQNPVQMSHHVTETVQSSLHHVAPAEPSNDYHLEEHMIPLEHPSGESHPHPPHEDKHLELFHPTNEWQRIPTNAVLPDGIEVRMNLETGVKEVRLEQSGKGSKRHMVAPKEQVSHKMHRRISEKKTDVEQTIEHALSKDPKERDEALEWLDEEASTIETGIAMTEARNFPDFFTLLEDPIRDTRLQAASILAACLHNNGKAIENALLTNLVGSIVSRLAAEPDTNVRRRMIAIITYLLQGSKSMLMTQFVSKGGFTALETAASAGMDASMLERTMVLLALMAQRDEAKPNNYVTNALALLEKYLPQAGREFAEVSQDAFKPVCALEGAQKPPRYSNIVEFCNRFIHNK